MESIPMTKSKLIFIVFLIFTCQCTIDHRNVSVEPYNDILDNTILGQHCLKCDKPDGFITASHLKLMQSNIDTIQYFKVLDSLRNESTDSNRCLIEYSNDLNIFYRSAGEVDTTIRANMLRVLKDPFINRLFSSPVNIIVDTLVLQVQFDSNRLESKCAEIIPYVRDPLNPFSNGLGVLTFSRTFYSEDGTKGLVYYEFMCGRKCGRGEILLVEKGKTNWVVLRNFTLWSS